MSIIDQKFLQIVACSNLSLIDYRQTVSATLKAAQTVTPIRFFEAGKESDPKKKN
jgi:hypothetical protein